MLEQPMQLKNDAIAKFNFYITVYRNETQVLKSSVVFVYLTSPVPLQHYVFITFYNLGFLICNALVRFRMTLSNRRLQSGWEEVPTNS